MLLGMTANAYGMAWNTSGYWILLVLAVIIYVTGFLRASELRDSSTVHKDRDRPL